jgi:hypothetical protein
MTLAPVRSSLLGLSALLLVSGGTGCAVLKSIVGKNSVDLSKAQVNKVTVDIRKPEKTICPRERVQLVVTAEVLLEGEKQAKTFETYQGGADANKNDKLEFHDFAFKSDKGAFDEHGFFAPARNMAATAGSEYEVEAAFRRAPDKTAKAKYKPDYACIKDAGVHGEPGHAGDDGQSGRDGQTAFSGAGGGNGGNGGPGSGGADGSEGPRVQAFATFVKTPFHEKLLAVRITGATEDFLLAPADRPFVIRANGGAGGRGGSGGSGGNGGQGGMGQSHQNGGPGGDGGMGGPGGNGGRGGPGGTVELVYDAKFPELANLLVADVSGGSGGEAGSGGRAGNKGSGGGGNGQGTHAGTAGREGQRGANGASGPKGTDGKASMRAGSVARNMGELTAQITLLGDTVAAAPEPPAAADKGKKPAKPGAPAKPASSKPAASKPGTASPSKPGAAKAAP